MSTLVLIRHGECLSNQRRIAKNDKHDVLTVKGCTQARLTGKALKPFLEKRSFRVYSSTLIRAKLSADIIKSQFGSLIQVEYDNRLIEKSLANDFIESLISIDTKETLFLIITHGNLIESVISNILKLHDYSLIGKANNCGISILMDRQLLAYNMIIHLGVFL